jgi:TRAP-type transport system periplasmic protein
MRFSVSLSRFAAIAIACAAIATSVNAQEIKLRLGHPLTTADAAHTALVYFADNVKKRSNGRVDIVVYPADQMGRQKDVGEMVRQGANVIQLTDALFLGEWVPDAAILQAPYLMDKPDDFRKILGSDWLNDLNQRLAAKGVRVLSWNNYFGTRQILSKKPIRKPADLAGMNFRAAAAPMYVEMVKAMGAKPIVTGFAEVYTGLAQGTIDMLEAPLPTMWASKFYEQAKFVAMTGHMIAWDPVIMSETYFKALPRDVQTMLLEEAGKAAEYMGKLKLQEEEDIVKKYEAAGVTVIRDVDRDAFRKATAVVYDHYEGWTPGLRDKVRGLITK